MPRVETSQGRVHYEVLGSGPPVILIHGWTQAWNTWRSTIEGFQDRYRLYAPNLWGFGESRETEDTFQVTDFVEQIPQFMDGLGIIKAPIMGHSMGGTTALGMALKYPNLVTKVGVVGSPIDGRSLSLFLKLVGNERVASFMLSGDRKPMLRTFLRLWSPFVSRKNPQLFYEYTVENSEHFSVESFYRSIDSLRRTDLRERLPELAMPAMGIYGARDVIVNPNQIKLFRELVTDGKDVWIKNAGHFPMWDTPREFNQAFQQFMDM